ncbi:MAG: hypothetical protein RBG13Loki_2255 [Promethearchaeota archaeon CR_4]|nr:MAG: hypothetical protein RBG13Loki_2255 [Candidatus Lokiarchaeota archaeon CR_4]
MAELLRQFKSGVMKVDEPTMRMMSEMGYTVRFRKDHPEIIAEEIQYKLIMPPWVYIACIENFVLHFDVRDRLHDIQQPTLVHTGDRDALVKWTYSEFLAKHIPHAKLVVVPKQNHGTIREVPETVVGELDTMVGLK